MLFDNQFIIKATSAWEQEMGVEFTKEQCDLWMSATYNLIRYTW